MYKRKNIPVLTAVLFSIVFGLSACKTPETKSSSSSPSSSTSSSSSSSSGQGSNTSSGQGSASTSSIPGQSSTQTQQPSPYPADGTQSASTNSADYNQGNSVPGSTAQSPFPNQNGPQGTTDGQMTDDKILSEALDVFDKQSKTYGQQSGQTQSGTEAGGQNTGTSADDQGGNVYGNYGNYGIPGASSANTGNDSGDGSAGGQNIIIIGGQPGTEYSLPEGTETSGGGSYGSGTARTDAEQIVLLDRELNEQLGEFDGMILEKKQAARSDDNVENSQPVAAYYGYDEDFGENDAGGETAPLLTASVGKKTIEDSGGGQRPDIDANNRKGDYEHESDRSRIPSDIPDGSDDDVVARQLREAAMKEADPELREKLWDEYRKYKKGSLTTKR